MLNRRIGIQLASLRQPLKKALHTAARLGAQAVEIDARNHVRPEEFTATGLRQFRKLLDDLDLRVAAVAFPTRRGYGDLDDLDRRIAATKAAMKLARDLRTDVVVNHVGRVPDDALTAEWQTLVEALTDLGNYGHHAGARLAARTGSEPGEDLARLIGALPEGAIGVDLDPGRLLINGYSATDAVTSLGPHIIHVHANDAVRDLAAGRGLDVQMGRGSVDFPALLGALEEHDYRGWFTIERRTSDDPVAEIGDAVNFLRSL